MLQMNPQLAWWLKKVPLLGIVETLNIKESTRVLKEITTGMCSIPPWYLEVAILFTILKMDDSLSKAQEDGCVEALLTL